MRVDWKHEWAHQTLTKEHVYTVHAFVLNISQFKSKMTKGPVLAGLGGKGLRKRDGQITLSQPEASPWWVKSPGIRQSKITKGHLGGKGLTILGRLKTEICSTGG